MFYGLRDRLRRARFGLSVRGLLDSPPLRREPSLGLTVVSQLQHKDVLMYLAAVKSFARYVPVARVRVLDDGTLTERDRHLLQQHVPGINVEPIATYHHPDLPAGGCWERLIGIADLSRSGYVIQLDSDTIALGPLPEVVEAVQANRAFTIGTWDGQTLEPAAERAPQARTGLARGNRHVQVVAEACFDELGEARTLLYVRGCAGFAGFAAGENKLQFILQLSREIEALIGPTWREWGSEQVMSNLVVANIPEATVLPHPDYADCTKMHLPGSRFVHFIGPCRFANGRYAKLVNSLAL